MGYDPASSLFSYLSPSLSSNRRLLQTVISHRHTFDKYDKSFSKGLKKRGEQIRALIFGGALMGGAMTMAFTRFFWVNGLAEGCLKVGIFWVTSYFLSEAVYTIRLTKNDRPRLEELASKYHLLGS